MLKEAQNNHQEPKWVEEKGLEVIYLNAWMLFTAITGEQWDRELPRFGHGKARHMIRVFCDFQN